MRAMTHREHAALSLAHRWFAFLESSAGNVEEHLDIFTTDVILSGRRSQVRFAHGHDELRQWFAAIPDEVSSHRILHSSWSQKDDDKGKLDFVVAYQSPATDGTVDGSIISYETLVSFSDGTARFASLDKTPILANTRAGYAPTWAEHRVQAFVHALLGRELVHHDAQDVLGGFSPITSAIETWAPVAEQTIEYQAILWIGTAEGNLYSSCWAIHDDGATPFPDISRIAPLRLLAPLDGQYPSSGDRP